MSDTNTEWQLMMKKRIESILDNSNNLYDTFVNQKNKDSKISELHQKSEDFTNLSKDEILYTADLFSRIIYATPLHDDFFYVFNDSENIENREMVFFTSFDELKTYQEVNEKTSFVCLRYRDLITLKNFFKLTTLTLFLKDYILTFNNNNLDSFYVLNVYKNVNTDSKYHLQDPTTNYREEIFEFINYLEQFNVKNIWVYNVTERKDVFKPIIDDVYEVTNDFFVIEMDEDDFINIRDYLEIKIKRKTQNTIKVIRHDSHLGTLLLKNKTVEPIYKKY